MLQTIEEVKKADLFVGSVINGVDNPNLLSVDSTTPIQTEADTIVPENEAEKTEVKVDKPADSVTTQKETPKLEKQEAVPAEEKKEDGKEKIEQDKKPAEEEVKLDPVEKRIGKLTKKWRSAERERDYERDKRIEAEVELKKLKETTPQADKPKRSDFDDEDKFLEALADWKIDGKLKMYRAEEIKRGEEDSNQQVVQEVEQELLEVSERGRDKYEDYDEVVFAKDLPLTKDMVGAILLSDTAEDIFHYLGSNPDIAADISEMNPLKAAKEIGKIEAALLKPKEEKKKEVKEEVKIPAPSKKLTKTPEPIEPVKTDGVIEKDPNQMSSREYRAWRERNK